MYYICHTKNSDKMSRYPKSLVRFFPSYVFALAVPAFFLISVLLYEPKALCELMRAGEGMSAIENVFSFNCIITFTILLALMSLSRVLLWLLRRHLAMDIYKYCIWCLGEIVVCGAFVSMYLVLMARGEGEWFGWFGRSVICLGSVAIFPYIILTLFLYARENAGRAVPESDARLKFYDNRHQLKFITETSSILYIESNENYIIIHYLENGIEKRVQIRNSMKSIEPLCEKAGFARAHRCYIVNPMHVKSIRKGAGGQNFADLGTGDDGLPISKKYYDSIASML